MNAFIELLELLACFVMVLIGMALMAAILALALMVVLIVLWMVGLNAPPNTDFWRTFAIFAVSTPIAGMCFNKLYRFCDGR